MATTNPGADLGAAIAGLLLGQHFSSAGAASNVPPQLTSLLNTAAARQTAQNPLFGAVNSGIYQMLPNFARNGAAAFTPNMSAFPSSSGSGGGISPLTAGIAGAGGGALLASLLHGSGNSGAGGNLSGIVNAIRNIFTKGGQPNVVGSNNSDVFGTNLPSYQDPFGLNGGYNGGAVPGLDSGGIPDPSGGTGIGPGMQGYYGDQGGDPSGSIGDTAGTWYNDPLYGGGGS